MVLQVGHMASPFFSCLAKVLGWFWHCCVVSQLFIHSFFFFVTEDSFIVKSLSESDCTIQTSGRISYGTPASGCSPPLKYCIKLRRLLPKSVTRSYPLGNRCLLSTTYSCAIHSSKTSRFDQACSVLMHTYISNHSYLSEFSCVCVL